MRNEDSPCYILTSNLLSKPNHNFIQRHFLKIYILLFLVHIFGAVQVALLDSVHRWTFDHPLIMAYRKWIDCCYSLLVHHMIEIEMWTTKMHQIFIKWLGIKLQLRFDSKFGVQFSKDCTLYVYTNFGGQELLSFDFRGVNLLSTFFLCTVYKRHIQ